MVQFSAFAFFILIIIPNLLFSVSLRSKNVPIKISLQKPNLPIQLVVFGFVFPLIAYSLSYFVLVNIYTDLSPYTPIKAVLGLLKPLPNLAVIFSIKWFVFFALYYGLCISLAVFAAWVFVNSGKLQKAMVSLRAIDEEEFANYWRKKVNISLDIMTNDGQFIYSGKLEDEARDIYFQRGSIVLTGVLKIPIASANIPIQQYICDMLVDENRKLDSSHFLQKMIFPKNNIVNLNVTVRPKDHMKIELF